MDEHESYARGSGGRGDGGDDDDESVSSVRTYDGQKVPEADDDSNEQHSTRDGEDSGFRASAEEEYSKHGRREFPSSKTISNRRQATHIVKFVQEAFKGASRPGERKAAVIFEFQPKGRGSNSVCPEHAPDKPIKKKTKTNYFLVSLEATMERLSTPDFAETINRVLRNRESPFCVTDCTLRKDAEKNCYRGRLEITARHDSFDALSKIWDDKAVSISPKGPSASEQKVESVPSPALRSVSRSESPLPSHVVGGNETGRFVDDQSSCANSPRLALRFACSTAKDDATALALSMMLCKANGIISPADLGVIETLRVVRERGFPKTATFLDFLIHSTIANVWLNELRLPCKALVDLYTLQVRTEGEAQSLLRRLKVDTRRPWDVARAIADEVDKSSALLRVEQLAVTVGRARTAVHGQREQGLPLDLIEFICLQNRCRDPLSKYMYTRQRLDDFKTSTRNEDIRSDDRSTLDQLEVIAIEAQKKSQCTGAECMAFWKQYFLSRHGIEQRSYIAADADFAQVQDARQVAFAAATSLQENTSLEISRQKTKSAMDDFDQVAKRLGISQTSFMAVRASMRNEDLRSCVQAVEEAFNAELATWSALSLLLQNFYDKAHHFLACAISYYARAATRWADVAQAVSACKNRLEQYALEKGATAASTLTPHQVVRKPLVLVLNATRSAKTALEEQRWTAALQGLQDKVRIEALEQLLCVWWTQGTTGAGLHELDGLRKRYDSVDGLELFALCLAILAHDPQSALLHELADSRGAVLRPSAENQYIAKVLEDLAAKRISPENRTMHYPLRGMVKSMPEFVELEESSNDFSRMLEASIFEDFDSRVILVRNGQDGGARGVVLVLRGEDAKCARKLLQTQSKPETVSGSITGGKGGSEAKCEKSLAQNDIDEPIRNEKRPRDESRNSILAHSNASASSKETTAFRNEQKRPRVESHAKSVTRTRPDMVSSTSSSSLSASLSAMAAKSRDARHVKEAIVEAVAEGESGSSHDTEVVFMSEEPAIQILDLQNDADSSSLKGVKSGELEKEGVTLNVPSKPGDALLQDLRGIILHELFAYQRKDARLPPAVFAHAREMIETLRTYGEFKKAIKYRALKRANLLKDAKTGEDGVKTSINTLKHRLDQKVTKRK